MKSLKWLALAALALTCFGAPAQAAQTTVKFHGHAAFSVTTPKGHVLFIDPWLKNPQNPAAKDGKDPLAEITKADYILLTHGHFDHVGDAVALAKKTGAKLVTNFELGTQLVQHSGFPEAQAGMDTLTNIGAKLELADGEVTLHVTPAVHSSGLDIAKEGEKPNIVYGGESMGFVLEIKNGPTIYHSGDTAYFKDMEVIGERLRPDLALINIGGHFGMSPPMAARAAKAVAAKLVVPMHFKTFPILTQSAEEFFKVLGSTAHREIQPGESLVFEGRKVRG